MFTSRHERGANKVRGMVIRGRWEVIGRRRDKSGGGTGEKVGRRRGEKLGGIGIEVKVGRANRETLKERKEERDQDA